MIPSATKKTEAKPGEGDLLLRGRGRVAGEMAPALKHRSSTAKTREDRNREGRAALALGG